MDRIIASLIVGLAVLSGGAVMWVVFQAPWLLVLFFFGWVGGYLYDVLSERSRAG